MFKKYFSFCLLWMNALFVCMLLLSTYLPSFNPATFWLPGFIGLLFPFLFLLNLLLIAVWALTKQTREMMIAIFAALCCLPAAFTTWGMHRMLDNDALLKQHDNKSFTLMTFNTSSMGLTAYVTDKAKESAIYNAIADTSPDILCLQEFYTNEQTGKEKHIDSIKMKGNYPHYYFTRDKIHWDTWCYGIILFSKYPIIDAAAVPCGKSEFGSGSSFLQADLLINEDTIRIFSVQLTSYMFNNQDYDNMKAPKGKGIFSKMRRTFAQRSQQALQLQELIAVSPYPVVVCGDFNDTPVSFTYRTISSNLQDAFLSTQFGWGRTLSFLSPSLRIDYILPQRRFTVHGSKTLKVAPSEHFPLIARLSLKKD
ncbi:hypothetical protein DVR12_09780 [Chitinophaga silvatica]|uniref:Endonuclease/exonuclease/phosphatase domain-containing protein n=1 Tax=Chitinophaga silvatica TaxID=2282649 RepID=A0A3E1YBB2_9BACT|nr:endonuclease/exonuclease/phosphatase family protein [Chitinophaga silvatica]RFS23300.1 hypothetical protein DVR12_09780 [Chitinophaga silvatica]